MYVILTWDEEDMQSSKMSWNVWYPYMKHGFETRKMAEEQILKEGSVGLRYHVCEVLQPVTPARVLASVAS